MRWTLAAVHQRMSATVDEMGPSELEAVARFLSGMIHAVHESQDLDEGLREAVADSDAARPNSRRRGPQSPAVADEASGQADDAS